MPISSDYDPNKFFQRTTIEGNEEIDFLSESPLDFDFDTINQKFRIQKKHVGRPDLIANETLNSPVYWWVILLANDVEDPFQDFEVGDVIVIPKPSEVFQFLEEMRKSG